MSTETNQLQLPYEEITTVANRSFLRENFSRANREVYKIPIEKLEIREGFNKRTVYEGIEELAASIKEHGLKDPLTVDVLPNGKVFIEKGHRRFKAIQYLIEQGEKIEEVECYPNPASVTELDRMLDIYTSNMHSCQLTAYEQAAVVFDLKYNFGEISNETIGNRLGISRQKVDMLLLIAEAPDDIKEQIKLGTMGITEATDLVRKAKKSQKDALKKEEDSHKTPVNPSPDPKDELAGDIKELNELEKPSEAENWWNNLAPDVRASLMAEYFGDDMSEIKKPGIEEIYSGEQAAQELAELLEVSDEIKVREDTLPQHIGRKLSAAVVREWTHEYEEGGEPQSRDMSETIAEKNAILTEELVAKITTFGEIDTIFVYKQGMEPVAASVITVAPETEEKSKWDLSRPEMEKIQKAIQAGDKIEAIVSKLDVPEQTKTDLGYQVHWLIENLTFVRDWCHKNKVQNKRGS